MLQTILVSLLVYLILVPCISIALCTMPTTLALWHFGLHTLCNTYDVACDVSRFWDLYDISMTSFPSSLFCLILW